MRENWPRKLNGQGRMCDVVWEERLRGGLTHGHACWLDEGHDEPGVHRCLCGVTYEEGARDDST